VAPLGAVRLPGKRRGADTFAVIDAEGSEGRRQWVVRRKGGAAHLVEDGPRGWWCDCTAWKFGCICRHVQAVQEILKE